MFLNDRHARGTLPEHHVAGLFGQAAEVLYKLWNRAMDTKSPAQNISESNSIGVDLQITYARVALTFLDLAESTHVAQAPDAYKHFDDRDPGWTKVILSPNA